MGSEGTRAEKEAQLLDAVQKTKAAYEFAKQECERLKIYAVDLGNTQSDGAYAYGQALRGLGFATEHYRQALIEFNRFIIDRKPIIW
jgi:hypothetical protein